MDKEDQKNVHVALGEAVMSILDSQSALSNHAIMDKLQQLAETETDEEKVMSYWEARKAFRHIPQSVSGLRRKDAGNTDAKTVKFPQNRFGFRRTRSENFEDSD
ncbi:hypothetical protein M1E08_04805 [Erwinia sp. PK3-005]|uniref:Uncharacterized protein n=1 Tax=Mixta hanseatica TaxID=2872648 RepID=A0ABY4R513_9GAMM|nr:hypothetical protein [Mixta hanseatica]UQY43341.1 hypothetical protein K6958_15845 [Mixta hanseatica]